MSRSGGSPQALGLPGYALAAGARGSYDPLRHLYNPGGKSLQHARAGLSQAQAGLGFFDIGIIADSLALFNGVAYAQGWPAAMRKQLASMFGLVERPGLIPGFGMQDVNSYAAGMGTGGATYPFSVSANSTWTCAIPVASTSITLIGPKTNPAAATTTIDAVAANPFPIPGGAGEQAVVLGSGLADALHTVVVTTGAGGGAFHGIYASAGASGIRVHNLALTGTDVATGNAQKSWSDLTAASLLSIRLAMLAAAGITPHLWIYCLGTNDPIDNPAITIPALSAGTRATIAALPGAPGTAGATSDLILVPPWSGATVPVALQQAVAGNSYTLADSYGCPAVDWYDRVQGQAGGFATGVIGSDGLHASAGGNKQFGIALAELIAA